MRDCLPDLSTRDLLMVELAIVDEVPQNRIIERIARDAPDLLEEPVASQRVNQIVLRARARLRDCLPKRWNRVTEGKP